MDLRVKRLRESAQLPKRMTADSAGFDLFACVDEPITIAKGQTEKIPTGICVSLDAESGYVLLIYARSSLAAKHGIAPANCVGVVDLDYRGEIFIPLHNSSSFDFTVNDGERVAQLVVTPIVTPEIVEADELDETQRGSGGFGSTGTN
ncbi:MAG: dUTP diphosphatase [Ruminococcus sp.]|nr:dUTP diphosphatase [Ruminococcus sp.]